MAKKTGKKKKCKSGKCPKPASPEWKKAMGVNWFKRS